MKRDARTRSDRPASPLPGDPLSWFWWLTLGSWGLLVLVAAWLRTRAFAMFVGVLVGIYALIAVAMAKAFVPILPVFATLHVTVFVNFIALTRPRMRPLVYRLLVSWPASFFAAGTLLALPWALAFAAGFALPWPWLPYALATLGMVQSLTTKRETIDLSLANRDDPSAQVAVLAPHPRGKGRVERPLRIVQISDPHIGPFMSVARLSAICERAVEAKPDLVLLTGDFLTMESHSDARLLLDAFAPLKKLPGRVYACHGNHDHEAPRIVSHACEANGIELLLGDSRLVETDAGPVQIVGTDFVWRDRKAYLARVCEEHPRIEGVTRLVLLHDPSAFHDLPEGEGDLVLSGHTHGGQVGLVSLGLAWTFLRLAGNKMPDHGYWAKGHDRLWVHRGTGHYGFPLRLGVPAEESVLQLHRA